MLSSSAATSLLLLSTLSALLPTQTTASPLYLKPSSLSSSLSIQPRQDASLPSSSSSPNFNHPDIPSCAKCEPGYETLDACVKSAPIFEGVSSVRSFFVWLSFFVPALLTQLFTPMPSFHRHLLRVSDSHALLYLFNLEQVLTDPIGFYNLVKCGCTETFSSAFTQCLDCFERTDQTFVCPSSPFLFPPPFNPFSLPSHPSFLPSPPSLCTRLALQHAAVCVLTVCLCWSIISSYYLTTQSNITDAGSFVTELREVCGLTAAILGGVAKDNSE